MPLSVRPVMPEIRHSRGSALLNRAPEALILTGGALAAFAGHQLVKGVGVLTWAVLLGALIANTSSLPHRAGQAPGPLAKLLLRIGIVLLGLSLSLRAVFGLGWELFALVAGSLVATLFLTYWLARWLGLDHSRSLLIAAGFSICGASAVAAMEEPAGANEDDVANAIALVTLFGTAMMIAIPLLQLPLGLDEVQLGVWAGASVHEVGQVVAAAGPAGLAAVGIAIVVKLTRVLFLAPIVIGVQLLHRRASRRQIGTAHEGARPPLVPVFILGFLACVLIRTTELVPESVLGVFETAQTAALAGALFGLGLGVNLRGMLRSTGRAAVVATVSTIFIGSATLAGVVVIV